MNESIKMVLVLVAVSIVSAIALTIVYEFTYPIILENKLGELKSSLESVIPNADLFEEIDMDYLNTHITKSYKALESNQIVGYAFLLETPGYQGNIKLLVGTDKNEILNVVILEHTETPGLGSRITDEQFTGQFKGSEEFDAITGATVSSNAVINAVNEVKDYIKKIR